MGGLSGEGEGGFWEDGEGFDARAEMEAARREGGKVGEERAWWNGEGVEDEGRGMVDVNWVVKVYFSGIMEAEEGRLVSPVREKSS